MKKEEVRAILLKGAKAAAGARPLKGESMPQPVTVMKTHLVAAVGQGQADKLMKAHEKVNAEGESVSVCPVALVKAIEGSEPASAPASSK